MFVNGSGKNEQFYKGPSIDASYQVSVHLAEGFQRRRLKCEKLTDETTNNGRQVMPKAHIDFGIHINIAGTTTPIIIMETSTV